MSEEPLTDNITAGSLLCSDFPYLPEFPCLSTSSSSSFSSVACWDVMKSDTEEDHHVVNNINNNESGIYVDVIHQPPDSANGMETFECMDLLDGGADILDNHGYFSSVFGTDDQTPDLQYEHQHIVPEQQESGEASKDLAMLFLEWLKSNKDSISAENLRKVKLKRSTIESAIKRYGGGKGGMKKLLKLILEWVRSQHLQNQGKGKHMTKLKESSHSSMTPNPDQGPKITDQNYTNFIVHSPPDHNPGFSISNWNIPKSPSHQLPPTGADSAAMETSPRFSSAVGCTSESVINSNHPCTYTNMVNITTWSPSQVAVPCATKEARQKRMARQKRVSPHHKPNHSYHSHQQKKDQHNQIESYHHPMPIGTDNKNYANSPATASQDDPFNWVCWP